MKHLLALYPKAWRRRYGAEFEALLEDEGGSFRVLLDVLIGALDAHLFPQGWEKEHRMRFSRAHIFVAIGALFPLLLIVLMALGLIPRDAELLGFVVMPFTVGLLIGRWWAPLVMLSYVWIVMPIVVWLSQGLSPISVLLDDYTLFLTVDLSVVSFIGYGARVLTAKALHLVVKHAPARSL